MRFLFWLVVLPLAVASAFFAVANREPVTVNFFPLPFATTTASFVLIIVSVFIGLLIGGIATWIGQHHWRAQARALHRRVRHLEGEIEGLRARTIVAAPPAATTPVQTR